MSAAPQRLVHRSRSRSSCQTALVLLADRWRRRGERGDIPGWVLVTVMTITIGMGLWGLAQPQLVGILQSALSSVR